MAEEVLEEGDGILTEFLSWCEQNGLILSKKVKVGLQGSCHRYGMVAVEDIEEGECLFEIPRSLVLQPKTSSISGTIESLSIEDQIGSERGSGWAPLLLTLMYEYTNPASHWKPYLNLVRDHTVLDQPMFWGLEERQKELQGTGIEEDVENDVQRIEEEYNAIALPFIKKHQKLFSESLHTVTLYKHMAAFVMAYSFTEQESNNDDNDDDEGDVENNDATPMMVPMADILNHISNNNAHLEFGAKSLTMVATQDICKGQEIFNTYGKLANCHLLQSYGFVEDELPNPYDMVEVPIAAFSEVLKENQSKQAAGVLDAKFEFMEEMGVASEDDEFLFGREGFSQFGPDLYATLRILHLTKEQFKQLLEEQIQQERSEEFDDIGHVLDQTDDELKRDTSWRILELVYKAENKKKKRRLVEKESRQKQKKMKSAQNDELSDSRKDPNIRSKDCSKLYTNVTSVDRNTDMSRASKQDLVQANGAKSAGKNKMSESNDDDDRNIDEDDNDDDEADNSVIGNDDDQSSNDDDEEEEEENDSEDDNNEQEESEQPLTYELMSQWPIEWRRTLKSVSEWCVKQRYGDDNTCEDSTEDDKLSKRQLSVMRIKRAQRSIFRRICELAVQDNSQG